MLATLVLSGCSAELQKAMQAGLRSGTSLETARSVWNIYSEDRASNRYALKGSSYGWIGKLFETMPKREC